MKDEPMVTNYCRGCEAAAERERVLIDALEKCRVSDGYGGYDVCHTCAQTYEFAGQVLATIKGDTRAPHG